MIRYDTKMYEFNTITMIGKEFKLRRLKLYLRRKYFVFEIQSVVGLNPSHELYGVKLFLIRRKSMD